MDKNSQGGEIKKDSDQTDQKGGRRSKKIRGKTKYRYEKFSILLNDILEMSKAYMHKV